MSQSTESYRAERVRVTVTCSQSDNGAKSKMAQSEWQRNERGLTVTTDWLAECQDHELAGMSEWLAGKHEWLTKIMNCRQATEWVTDWLMKIMNCRLESGKQEWQTGKHDWLTDWSNRVSEWLAGKQQKSMTDWPRWVRQAWLKQESHNEISIRQTKQDRSIEQR